MPGGQCNDAQMKPTRNRLQLRVLRRLEAGHPPTHWQQFRLHIHTAWRRRRHWSFHRLWFHIKGVSRLFWSPWTLFRLGCVPVQVHATFLVYPTGIFTWDWYVEDASRGVLRALVFLAVFSFSLLFHEFGHVFAARSCGIQTRRVVLIPLGAVAELESMPRGPGEMWIALAGPVASFILAGAFWLALRETGPVLRHWLLDRYWLLELKRIFRSGCAVNLIVASFNLLPCFPMDGGRVLRSGLAAIIGHIFPQPAGRPFLVATRIAVRYVAWVLALGMMAWTLYNDGPWIHLVVFPLLVLVAEVEYRDLRSAEAPAAIPKG